jgi:hypothetical protein
MARERVTRDHIPTAAPPSVDTSSMTKLSLQYAISTMDNYMRSVVNSGN